MKDNKLSLTEKVLLGIINKAKLYESNLSNKRQVGSGLTWLEEFIRQGKLSNAIIKEMYQNVSEDEADYATISCGTCSLCGCETPSSQDEICQCCADSVSNSSKYQFDKFVDDIVVSESKRRKIDETTKSPQRKRAANNQDRPKNKILFKG